MGGATARVYKAIVWRRGSAQPPEHLTVEARDEAEARRLLVAQFGDQIVCSIWSEEDARERWPHTSRADEVREYKVIVWSMDPEEPGQRVTVHARSLDEAKTLVEEQFGKEIHCSIWNEEDANRTRQPNPPSTRNGALLSSFSVHAPHPGPFRETPVQDFLGPTLLSRLRPDAPPFELRWAGERLVFPYVVLDDTLRLVSQIIEAVVERRAWTQSIHRYGWIAELTVTPRGEQVEVAWRWTQPAVADSPPVRMDRRALLAQLRPLLAIPLEAVAGYTRDPQLPSYEALLHRLDAEQAG